ncbi:MAG: ATP synthase F0 subunit C [Armatimonadetes bacterium]|nr:ATP synthase F0 subunit C [Armatimonadota bacterium]
MLYGAFLALGTALGLPIAAAACGMAQGRAATSALEAIGRQPEAARDIQTNLIIALAMIESLTIYALIAFIMLQGKLAPVVETLSKLGQ